MCPAADASALEAWLAQPGHRCIRLDDPAYPTRLKAIPDPPPVLYCAGDFDLLDSLQLAIVGSRNPTPAGLRHAREFAAHLADRGLTITSGMALGVDSAAHRGALAARGYTIAVLGTGPDVIYPASHAALAAEIKAHGLIVSEFPPGTPPRRANFPQRNRILSGLSFGTLVVEAAPRSGSLITARLAAEQGREVFAMPGAVDNPLARGCHGLIRAGAKLVETADHILEELGPMMDNGEKRPVAVTAGSDSVPLDEDYQRLLQHIDNAPVSVDALVEATGFPVDTLSSMLLILELHGAVAVAPGGGYQRGSAR